MTLTSPPSAKASEMLCAADPLETLDEAPVPEKSDHRLRLGVRALAIVQDILALNRLVLRQDDYGGAAV